VSASDVTTSGFVVHWNAGGPSDVHSAVEYGTTTGYGATTTDAIGLGAKQALLAGLAPGTLYHFRVTAHSGSGNTTSPDATQFTATPIDIVIIGTTAPYFSDPTPAIPAGQPVVFTLHNADTMTHTWSLAGGVSIPDTGPIAAGTNLTLAQSVVLPTGSYTESCSLHTVMTRTLTV
jgi:hypothetical protein